MLAMGVGRFSAACREAGALAAAAAERESTPDLRPQLVNIFTYFDYRKFLQDAYNERRKENPNFSYRFIASKVGFSSPGFFANVLKGKKDISLKLALKFAELFKLVRKEKEYFELLVLFNKATGAGEKKEYLDRLLA